MTKDIAGYISRLIEEVGLPKNNHGFNASSFCEELGIDIDMAMYTIICLLVKEKKDGIKIREEYMELIREKRIHESILDDLYKDNGRDRQIAMVRAGLPIAKKKKLSSFVLKMRMQLGATDAEIMEEFGISRTTLWRKKKQIEEEQKQLKEAINKKSNKVYFK